jgi:long-chain acyl-CoA synthetase
MTARVYSKIVPNSEDPERGWGPIHRACDGQEPVLGVCDETTGEIVTTSYENFQLTRRKFGNRPFLGYRPIADNGSAGDYVWSTYEQVGKRADNFGSGLLDLDLCPARKDEEVKNRGMLGFYSKNRAEWVIAEQGCFTQAIVTVPMYDTLGADSVAYVINQCSLKTVLCSAETVSNVLECKQLCPSLECLIQMEPVSEDLRKKASDLSIKAYSLEEVEKAGNAKPVGHHRPTAEDIFTFCYTSGTTGEPKGTLLAHGDMISVAAAGRSRPTLRMKETDVHLSYLPLPHIFERLIQFNCVAGGSAIGFYQGETLKILEDLTALRPTVFPSVPRLLNRIHDRLRAGVEEAGGLKKVLFDKAYAAKKAGLANGTVTHPVWDRLVFSKIKARVGLDRVRAIITGSAPISDHVLDFLRIVFGCVVLEGYGLSETTAGGTITMEDDLKPGTVGAPIASNEIRLQDVPDMGYFRTDQVHSTGKGSIPCHGRGEICMRGRNVFKGYYKMPEKTAEAIDSEGWFHSGDIGLWTPDGRLKIIDRKKNIFKLAQGEYVAPEKLENLNVQSKFVMQNFVYGDSLKTQLVAIIVVDPDSSAQWAKSKGVQKSHADVCKDEEFKKAVMADLQKLGTKAHLAGFEFVKAIHLEAEQWQPGGEVLTPTFKLQRNKAQQKYQAIIDALYQQLEATPSKL